MECLVSSQFEGHRVDTLSHKGRECWLCQQVSVAWGYNDPHRLSSLIRRWTERYPQQFRVGEDYDVVQGAELKALKELIPCWGISWGSRAPHVILLYKSGLEAILTKTRKPIGDRFVNWLKDELLPAAEHYVATRDTSPLDAALRISVPASSGDALMFHLQGFMQEVAKRQGSLELALDVVKGDVRSLQIAMYSTQQQTVEIKRTLSEQQKVRLKRAQRYGFEDQTNRMRHKLAEFANYACLRCKQPVKVTVSEHHPQFLRIDHVRDCNLYAGNYTWDNLQVLCDQCHKLKTAARARGDLRIHEWDFRTPEFVAAIDRYVRQQESRRQEKVLPLFQQDCCMEEGKKQHG